MGNCGARKNYFEDRRLLNVPLEAPKNPKTVRPLAKTVRA
jgi:hypothetical protein